MSEENVISLIMAAVWNTVDKNAKVFNLSVDFIQDAPDMLSPFVKILHQGHKTIVLDVQVQDMNENLIAKSLVTLLKEK